MRLETERLWLDPITLSHLDAFTLINAHPDVMRHIGAVMDRAGTAAWITGNMERWAARSYGWWALTDKASGEVLGGVTVQNTANVLGAPMEIGWRLCPTAQGKGYATEGARAAMTFAFETLGVDHLISVADPENIASHKVMERLGMIFRGIETHYNVPCTTYVITKAAAS